MTEQAGIADRDTLVRRLLEYDQENQRLLNLLDRCETILINMALENTGWRRFFRRWEISDEPLRNDAKNLLPLLNEALSYPDGEDVSTK